MNDNWRVQNSVEAFVAKLDAFAVEFDRMAATPQQKLLAEQFKEFVETAEPATLGKAAVPAIVRDYAAAIHKAPDLSMER
jgi:hypothetical protein